MKPEFTREGNIAANCPDCGARTTFENRTSDEYLSEVEQPGGHYFQDTYYQCVVYLLLRCAGCGRGGVAEIHCISSNLLTTGEIGEFYPISAANLTIPENIPTGIKAEYREAEKCISFGAWRAASALLRSTLEKTLVENGYTDTVLTAVGKRKNLYERIQLAGVDGVITASRQQRAQEDIRVLGNDVLHEEWRDVTEEEVLMSHKYVQRILEDFYDDRPTVESVLVSKGRIIPTPAASTTSTTPTATPSTP
ncbi:DUF4145 domain-containing protein [Neobacillus vireti]|uniref:DUF4145 domain-containing protein n=1 Tax=Neobacillus vireti TaxID=220686 RepID=UPI002FFFF88B